MDCKEAIIIFENNTKKSVVQIDQCSVGIAYYVFSVSTADEKFILRCGKEEDAYKAIVYWLSKLSVCKIPIPIVLSKGIYREYSYLDDISTKNILIYEGKVSGIMDIDYLLVEIHPNTIKYKAFIFYCLLYCVDFMGERGMQFLDKKIPVNESIIERLNDIFDRNNVNFQLTIFVGVAFLSWCFFLNGYGNINFGFINI